MGFGKSQGLNFEPAGLNPLKGNIAWACGPEPVGHMRLLVVKTWKQTEEHTYN